MHRQDNGSDALALSRPSIGGLFSFPLACVWLLLSTQVPIRRMLTKALNTRRITILINSPEGTDVSVRRLWGGNGI